MVTTIIAAIIGGLIIGALARLILPGRQDISILMTIVLGILGSAAGSWLYTAISGKSGTKGIDWIAFILGLIVAMILITVYLAVKHKARSRV